MAEEIHYRQLFQYLSEHECRNILEAGTHCGENAVKMIKASKAPEEEIRYFGFDMFEPLSPEQSSLEYSGVYSNPPPLEEVKAKIESETKAKVLLFKGDSKETIPQNLGSLPIMDIIYIDGGHSIPTVASDWNNLKQLMGPETVTFFDDYFPDILDMGCKPLSDTIGQGYQVKVHDGIDSYGPPGESLLRIQLMSVRKVESPWRMAQVWEQKWWGTCQNTYHEEEKQLDYAQGMGLTLVATPSTPYSFDLDGKSVLDVGGGPVSLLLKCKNVSRAKVVDPITFPTWVAARYEEAGIKYEEIAAEDMNEEGWDEVWIYNVLQHVRDPRSVIEKAQKAGKLIRLFEWINIPVCDGHLHCLTEASLNEWLEGIGISTVDGSKYSGVFQKLTNRGVTIAERKSSSKMVHFFLTGGGLIYPYYLAIVSALKTQKADEIVLWCFCEPEGDYWPLLRDRVRLEIIDKPDFPALRDKDEHFRCAHLKDYFEWKILCEHGGMFLDLDTFCVKDVTYLNSGSEELVLADEVEKECSDYQFFSNAIVQAKRRSPIMKELLGTATDLLVQNEMGWGDTGPQLLTRIVKQNLDKAKVLEYGVLGGAGVGQVSARLYQKEAELWDQAKILHLFGKACPQFANFTEEYIKDSDILFARVVKDTLLVEEWAPTLAKGISCPHAVGAKGDPGPPGIDVKNKRFHLLGLPHIPTNQVEGLACAYSQKVIKLAKMLKSLGHAVFFYGVEGSAVECDEFIQVSTKAVLRKAYGDYDWRTTTYKHNLNDIAYTTFHKNAIREIDKRKDEYDYLLIPWNGHKRIYDAISTNVINDPKKLYLTLESGIGYRSTFASLRVFESYAWMHHVWGLDAEKGSSIDGANYDVVIPNYFDPTDFEYSEEKDDYFLCLGRVIVRKGLLLAKETVEAIGAKLLVAGQNGEEKLQGSDGRQFLDVLCDSPNVEYVGFADHAKRKKLLSKAKALFAQTQYIGPFEGVHVEANFSGTPVITTDWGCFTENVIHGVTGFRVRTLDHLVWAAKNIDKIKPADCRKFAMDNFTLDRVKFQYEEYFNMLMDIKRGKGWHEIHPERTELDWLSRTYP